MRDAESLYAGPTTATHPDGTHVSQAKIAFHYHEGASEVLAIAVNLTLYVAVLPGDLAKGAVLDCTSEEALPLRSMVATKTAHQIWCLAFSPSGDKLAAATAAGRVSIHSKGMCMHAIGLT